MGRWAGKAAQIGAPTLEAAMEVYLARPKLRSEVHKSGKRRQLKLHLKDWIRLPLDEISKAMAVRRHQELAKMPSGANHVLRSFRSIYNHARRTYDLPECPTMAIEWYEEKPDGRIIDDLKAWRQTIDDLNNPIHRVFYEFLLFTGLRKTEVLTLQWSSIQEDHIHLPMTKNGRSFDLPILQLRHEILAPLRFFSRKWVFPSPKSVFGHITKPERLKYNPHMHCRRFATVAMEAGALEEIVGRLLNHTPLSITGQRYTRPSLNALRP
jgi:integrase